MATTAELEAQIRQQWPSYVYLLEVPELKQLLLDAVNPDIGFSPEEFQAKFQATDWYRTHGDTQRQWEALVGSDPATAERQIAAKTSQITDLIKQLGLPGDWPHAWNRQVAQYALTLGLNDSELRDYLIQWGPQDAPTSTPTGDMGATYNEVRRLARQDYLVPLSDQDAWQWVKWITSGDTNMEGFKAALGDAAKGRFSHLTGILEQGITPGQYFAPYRSLVAQEMDLPSDAVDLMDPKWGDMLSKADGDKVRPMTLGEAQKFIRSKDEWKSTSTAKQMGAQMANQLLSTFGAIA